MINEQIRDREVRLIGESGEQLGIMPSKDALKLAKDAGLELGVKGSIVVNDRMETSVPDIYAVEATPLCRQRLFLSLPLPAVLSFMTTFP